MVNMVNGFYTMSVLGGILILLELEEQASVSFLLYLYKALSYTTFGILCSNSAK